MNHQLVRLIIFMLTGVVLILILATAALAWQGDLSDGGKDRIWVVVGAYVTGMFTIFGLLTTEKREDKDRD
jgi:hypothetical protein